MSEFVELVVVERIGHGYARRPRMVRREEVRQVERRRGFRTPNDPARCRALLGDTWCDIADEYDTVRDALGVGEEEPSS